MPKGLTSLKKKKAPQIPNGAGRGSEDLFQRVQTSSQRLPPAHQSATHARLFSSAFKKNHDHYKPLQNVILIPQINKRCGASGRESERAKGATTPKPRPPFCRPPTPAARVPAATRMRCMMRSPHAWRAPPALRERTDTGPGAGRSGRQEWRGSSRAQRLPLPNIDTAISFSHSVGAGRGGPGQSTCVGGRGEWQGGALRDGGGCPESVWGGEVCKSSNSGANGGSSQPTPGAEREGSARPLPQASPTPTLGA